MVLEHMQITIIVKSSIECPSGQTLVLWYVKELSQITLP